MASNECTNEDIDIHHRAFFSFNPALFLADLSNIGMDVCADGFDDFERCILEAEHLDQQTKAALAQVINETYVLMIQSLDRAAGSFEQYEQLTSLAVPSELFVEQPMPSLPEPVDPEQEAQVDRELQELREQISQAQAGYRQLKQQLNLVEKDVSKAAGRSSAFKPLVEAISSATQPLLEEAAAISQLAAKLQPMVAAAQQLQAEQQQQEPIGQALAAAAAAVGQAGDAVAAAAGGGSDGGDVERKVRQMVAESGASLEQLQAANAVLDA